MRDFLLFPAFLLAFVSCQSVEFPAQDGPERMLCLNARFSTADTLHTLYLACSEYTGITQADGTTVQAWVNGIPVQADAPDDKGICLLHARIRPSDTVSLTAGAPGCPDAHVVTLPVSVPEFRVENMTYTSADNKVHCRLQILDAPEEDNYYLVQLFVHREVVRSDGETVLDLYSELSPDRSEDPLQTDPAFLFTDRTFPGGTKTVELTAVVPILKQTHNTLLYREYFDEETQSWVKEKISYVSRNTLIARVSSLSEQDYWTSAWTMAERNQESTLQAILFGLKDIPVYPQNVQGGLGLVCTRSADEYHVYFEFHYDINSYWNPEIVWPR